MKGTAGLAKIGGGGEGRPLGLFTMDTTFRDQIAELDSQRWLHGLTRASERAPARPNIRVISVCDREGDFWELLATSGINCECAIGPSEPLGKTTCAPT